VLPSGEPAKPVVAPNSGTASPADLVLKVAGAVGTGLGILGFVTLFGGAILWIRAKEAHLPANDVVSVIPNSVLVTTGASFLVPAVLIAGFVVALIFLVHLGCRAIRSFEERDEFRKAHTFNLKAEELSRDADAAEELAKAARALAVSTGNHGDEKAAEEREAEALEARSKAAMKKAAAENLRAKSETAVARTRNQFYFELVLGGLLLAILPPWLNGAIGHLHCLSVIALILVAAATVAVSLLTYATTNKFIWFGLVAFVMVGVYIGFATYFSTTNNPKVEPAAALRAGRPPVVGIFIADTASNLYLGSFPDEERTPRLLVLPRAQVTDLAIGPLMNPERAPKRAAQLGLDRCKQKIEVPKTDKEPASFKPACTEEEKEALKDLRG